MSLLSPISPAMKLMRISRRWGSISLCASISVSQCLSKNIPEVVSLVRSTAKPMWRSRQTPLSWIPRISDGCPLTCLLFSLEKLLAKKTTSISFAVSLWTSCSPCSLAEGSALRVRPCRSCRCSVSPFTYPILYFCQLTAQRAPHSFILLAVTRSILRTCSRPFVLLCSCRCFLSFASPVMLVIAHPLVQHRPPLSMDRNHRAINTVILPALLPRQVRFQ